MGTNLGADRRKSSHSGSNGSNGGECVEVALWHKSSYSGSNGGGCVEVTRNLSDVVAVRDSKDPDGPRLAFSPDDWRAFTARIKAGQLDSA